MKIFFISFLLFTCEIALPATFIVINNDDSGSGSFRQAIIDANSNGIVTLDYIKFNIPGTEATNVTINLLSELPGLSSNIIIDGFSQPSSLLGSNNIRIAIARGNSTFFHGLSIENDINIEIYGLYFRNFLNAPGGAISEKKAGIFLKNCDRVIIKFNGFGGNSIGILSPFDLTANQLVQNLRISANIIGLTADGENAAPNEVGVDLSFLKNCIVGSDQADEGNLIASNTITGIACAALEGSIKIKNNIIGYNLLQTKTFNSTSSSGINLYSNRVNSNLVVSSNTVVSQKTGIYLEGVNNGFAIINNSIGGSSSSNIIRSNQIGVHINGCQGTTGFIGGASLADQNNISYNSEAIIIERSYPVSILKNSIYCNVHSIGFKELPVGKSITMSKIDELGFNTAKGIYLPNSMIELFYDDECADCQGKIWISSIPTSADGSWEYINPVPFTGGITSTGTNTDGATSSFSKPIINDRDRQVTGTFCGTSKGSIKSINVTDASVFKWYNSSAQIVSISRDLIDVPAGDYYFTAGQSGSCEVRSATYTILNTNINYQAKTAHIIPANCNTDNGSIFISSYETDVPVAFEWKDANGRVIGTEKSISNLKAGIYTLVASNGLGCKNVVRTFEVLEAIAPIINLSELKQSVSCDGNIVSVSGIRIVGLTSPYSYKWFDESDNEIQNSLDLRQVRAGKYYLEVTDKFDCKKRSDLLDFNNVENQLVKIPNFISPNGDGVNDIWKVPGSSNYPTAIFSIYNRYGKLVFYSKGYDVEFDGTYKDRPLPTGVYYYVINLQSGCQVLNGSLTIIR